MDLTDICGDKTAASAGDDEPAPQITQTEPYVESTTTGDDGPAPQTTIPTDSDVENISTVQSVQSQSIQSQSIQSPSSLERAARRRRVTKMGNMVVRDHFSLSNPTSTVAFAEDESILFVDNHEQVVLERKAGHDEITAKQVTVSSPGLMLLRMVYTLVASLMSGLLFVFCVQLVLFLFLGLAIESGLTSQKGLNFFTFIGTLFSIPVFVSSLSQIMAIATSFVIDTWKGSTFMRTVVDWNSTLVDWLFCLNFIGIPIIVGSVALCSGTSEWWTITSITWFVLVFAYYTVFALSAVYYEVDGCLELIRYHPKLRENDNADASEYGINTFLRAVQLRMKQRLSGYKNISYTAHGSDPHPDKLSYYEVREKESYKSSIGIFSRFTRSSLMRSFYHVLDEPVRQYNVEDVLEFTPYITGQSWGLESVYCRNRSTRYIAIIDGVGALTKEQTVSSIVCFGFGTFLSLFAIVSLLFWFGLSAGPIFVIVLIYLATLYKSIISTVGLGATYNAVMTREDGNYGSIDRNKKSDGIYQVEESFRISEPKPALCWFVLGFEVVFFFIIPLIALFLSKNNRVGIVFIFMGIIYLLRDVCNAPACLRELGSLDGMELNNRDTDGTTEWREKNRFGKIISEISVGKRSNFWVGVFVVFTFVFCLIIVSAFAMGSDDGASDAFKFASREEFVYEGSHGVNYASCSMGHNIKTPDNSGNSLADFTFLTNIAYLDNNAATASLETWFEDSTVENLASNVTEFKRSYQSENGSSSVLYKLFDFPDQELKVVAVRGTSNSWDALTDAQLWSSAALSQYLRAILPLGEWWTPILPHIVKAISVIEDKSLENVAYYRETTAFVESLKKDGHNVQIVGHSLGGGLAMITGAQTEIPAIALSGPNTMISRKTYSPQITPAALDKYTFNIVPDRDPVPRIDDLAENYQRIKCRSPSNKPVDCHYGRRSLCEILYTCGSEKRPVPCFCVNVYGYDEPTSVNGEAFSNFCPPE